MAIQTLFGSVPTEPTLLDRLKSGIQKTRTGLMEHLETALAGRKEIDAELLEELEYTLISADIGVKTTSEVLEIIRQRVDRSLIGDAQELRQLIQQHLVEVLQATERPLAHVSEPPAVVMVVVSYMTGEPDYQKMKSLTYGTATAEDKAKTWASWDWRDVVTSLLVLLFILGAYLYFRG